MKTIINYNRLLTYLFLLSLNFFLVCSKNNNQREIIEILDIIPFGDRLHFSLFLKRGMNMKEVTLLYGEPRYIFYKDSTGCTYLHDNKKRTIEKVSDKSNSDTYKIHINSYDNSPYRINTKVYVYIGGFDAIAYLYIDSNETVEQVFIGGS